MAPNIKLEILLAELSTKMDLFREEQKELRQEVKDNMATVEDVEMIRVGYIKADESLNKTLSELKATIEKDYISVTTFKWTLLVAVLIAGAVARVDITSILKFFTKGLIP